MPDRDFTEYAPYAPANNIISMIRMMREKGLPDPLTHNDMIKRGISPESTSRLRRALHFLGLVHEDSSHTDTFKRLGKAPSDEYPSLLKSILEYAYADVFKTMGTLDDAQEKEYKDAFRLYEPKGQQSQMIRLFKALSEEAGILPEGTIPRVNVSRQTPRERTPRNTTGRKETPPAKDGDSEDSVEKTAPPPPSNGRDSTNELDSKYQLLQVLLKQLPSKGGWTQKRRDQWLQAVTSNVDLLIDVTEPDEPKEPQQRLPL